MASSRTSRLARVSSLLDEHAFAPAPTKRPRLADDAAAPVASRARALQDQLADVFETSAAPEIAMTERRWPPAATLGFIVATCGSFWLCAGFVVSRLVG